MPDFSRCDNMKWEGTSYIICKAQGKMEMWGPLYKNFKNFKMTIAKHQSMCTALQVPAPMQAQRFRVLSMIKGIDSETYC